MNDLPGLVQALQMALKGMLMYTAAHPRAQAALDTLTGLLESWLDENPSLHLATSNGKLFLDGTAFEGTSVHIAATVRLLTDRQISGIIFSRGVDQEEVLALLELLILKPARIEEGGGAARLLEARNLAHVKLAQIQYREVLEGDGGTQDGAGPSAKALPLATTPQAPAAEGTPGTGAEMGAGAGAAEVRLNAAQALAEQWRHEFKDLARHLGDGGGADLSFLGEAMVSVGLGDGYPSSQFMEGLRTTLLELPPEALLGVVAGLGTLPQAPRGLGMAFNALAPEAFAQATAQLLAAGAARGGSWEALHDRLYGILQGTASCQGLMAALEGELRMRGMGEDNLKELVARMDWDTMGLEAQLKLVQNREHFWRLSPEQRLTFMRALLGEGRDEAFKAILEQILASLTVEASARREAAARTLTGIAHWIRSPGLPPESEGPFLQGLTAHFGWEPLPQIHRATTEALGETMANLVARGEPGLALHLVQELESLCTFLDTQEPWRLEALAWLRERLGQPEALARVVELLHTATSETLLTELIPCLEAAGAPAARKLVEVLGEEEDRKRRGRLMEAIRGLGGQALPAIYEALDSGKWYLVRNTLNLLANLGDASVLGRVEACLAHPDGRVRRAAVRTLWKLGGPAAVPPLMKAFITADQETITEIMFAFGQIQSRATVPMLGDFATERRMPDKLRTLAVETLGLIRDPGATPYLEEVARRRGRFITSAEPIELRLAAIRSLLALGTPQVLASLHKLVAAEPRNSDRPLLQQLLDQTKP